MSMTLILHNKAISMSLTNLLERSDGGISSQSLAEYRLGKTCDLIIVM